MAWLWIGGAVALALFWAVGARSRLMRLRSDVLRQWLVVDAVWLKWVLRLQGVVSARQLLAWSSEADDLSVLQHTSEAVVEALAEARQQVWGAQVQQKLQESQRALMREMAGVIQRAPDKVKPLLQAAQAELQHNMPLLLVPHQSVVDQYNTALAQAPVSWLAQRLGLQSACTLLWPVQSEFAA